MTRSRIQKLGQKKKEHINTTFSEVFTFSWPTKKNGVAAYFNVPLFIAKRLATTTVISNLSMQLTQRCKISPTKMGTIIAIIHQTWRYRGDYVYVYIYIYYVYIMYTYKPHLLGMKSPCLGFSIC